MIDTLLPFLMLGILLAAVLARPMARLRWLSLPVVLVLLGFLASESWVALGRDTGLRWEILRDLVFYLLLPILIFEAAITIDVKRLTREWVLIGSLSVPLLVVSAVISAALLWALLGERLEGQWLVALLIGTMICATDPANEHGAVTKEAGGNGKKGVGSNLPRKIGSDPFFAGENRARDILVGESMLNDATTITLFAVVSGLLLMPEEEVSAWATLGQFVLVLIGGAALGVALGWLFDRVIDPANDKTISTAATLVLAFTSFWVGDHLLGLSGVMTTLAAGLTVAWRQRKQRTEEDIAFALDTWRTLSFLANAMLFFLVGMSITVGMFQQHWLAMLVGVLAALVSRAVIVFAGAGPISWLPGIGRLGFKDQRLVFWGGIRGAVAIALALSLSLEVPHWYLVQSAVYGVALFSLVVQVPLVGLVERHPAKPVGATPHRPIDAPSRRGRRSHWHR